MQTPASARQKRRVGEDEGAGLRTPASPIPHDCGDRGFHDRIDERDNDNNVSDQNLNYEEERGHAKTTPEQYSSGRPSSKCEDAHRHVAGDSIETKS